MENLAVCWRARDACFSAERGCRPLTPAERARSQQTIRRKPHQTGNGSPADNAPPHKPECLTAPHVHKRALPLARKRTTRHPLCRRHSPRPPLASAAAKIRYANSHHQHIQRLPPITPTSANRSSAADHFANPSVHYALPGILAQSRRANRKRHPLHADEVAMWANSFCRAPCMPFPAHRKNAPECPAPTPFTTSSRYGSPEPFSLVASL